MSASVGQVVERVLVEVGHRGLGPGRDGVVERLHLGHRAGEPLGRSARGSVGRHHVAAKGSRSANSRGQHRLIGRHLHRVASVVVDPLGRLLVQVAAQHFLVVEREPLDAAATRCTIWVASSVLASWRRELLERHRRHLLGDALTRRLRGQEVHVALEHVGVVRRRPVVVREVPALAPDQDHEVREQLERVEAPRVALRRGSRPAGISPEVGLVPRPEQAAAGDALHGLDHAPGPSPRSGRRTVLTSRCGPSMR